MSEMYGEQSQENAQPEAAEAPAPAKKAAPSAPKWETETRERVKAAVKKFQSPSLIS